MRFLVTGSDTYPGRNILSALQQAGFQCVGFDSAWAVRPDAMATLAEVAPTLIVNAHQYSGITACERDPQASGFHNLDLVRQVGEYASRQAVGLIQLSTCYVFDGSKRNPYKSASQGNPLNRFGQDKWQAECWVREHLPQSLVLRLGWLIGPEPDDLLERLALAKQTGRPVAFSDEHRGSPTAPDDVARVLVAIIKQLLCDAPVWGTYQYAGAEIVSQLAFARAAAEHFMSPQEVAEFVLCADAEQVAAIAEPVNAALGCIKIRNTFGIKQRPWRNYLAAILDEAVKPKLAGWVAETDAPKLSVSS